MTNQEVIIRKPRECELSALGEIWHTVFGTVGAKSFFDNIYNVEQTIIAEAWGKPAAMGHIIPAGELVCREHTLSCAMLYGIATLPEHRGMGLGKKVTSELIETAFGQGFEAVILCPSEESLYEYYSKNTKMTDWFYAKEIVMTFPIAAHSGSKLYLTPVSPVQYMEHRNRLLKDIPYINSSIKILEYQKKLCDELGGGLYKIGDSSAIVEIQPDGAVHVKELLTLNDDIDDVIACLTTSYEANEYIIRVPAQKDTNGINAERINAADINAASRFGMLALKDDILLDLNSCNFLPWYGMAFE